MITGERASTAAATIPLNVSKVPAFRAGIAKPSFLALVNQSRAVILFFSLLHSLRLCKLRQHSCHIFRTIRRVFQTPQKYFACR